MSNRSKTCAHVHANGKLCESYSLRDSIFCYWHHKARARRRRAERIGGPISQNGNSGVNLPMLEDANSIQIAVEEVAQAILDRRIDSKRAGLLLYAFQLAQQNLPNLDTVRDDEEQIAQIGADDESVFHDHIGTDPRAASRAGKTPKPQPQSLTAEDSETAIMAV